MTPSPFSLDSPSNRATSSHSIFSRLTAPFQGRSRSFADFEINLDEPLKEYRAGDAVKGNITLVVPKPVRITHLVLSLHGFAKVYKHAAAPGEGLPSEVKTPAPGRGRSGTEYLGNGLISLFEDEVILCGAGKLSLGQYSFGFEARFPFTSLPSSLSFERGTISYMLVATLTRPTAIAPTMFREKEVQFRETLDVATAPRPKQRKLHLKALKRSRRQPRRAMTDRTTNSLSNTNQSSTDSSDLPSVSMPRSSNASDTSRESGFDSLTMQSIQTPSGTNFNGETPSSPFQIAQDTTISASVDVLRGGFLPGDYIPLRILVKHTRALKSMHGIIVTLYRKARIDADPVIEGPAAATSENQARAGLRGLRLPGRSSHLYRMDLAQAFAPLIINPLNLEADIKTAVKIPDHVFPTVSTVPGQMIAFTYHVEIIMDLGGKFSKHERLLSGINMTSQAPVFSVGAKTSESAHGLPAVMEMYHLIDTSEIRREKGVAQETFEVLVGSTDSKRKVADAKKIDLWVDGTDEQDNTVQDLPQDESREQIGADLGSSPQYQAAMSNETIQRVLSSPPRLALPDLEEPTDEKARIRLAEERLLPSAPPDSEDYGIGSSTVPFAVASAPRISDLEGYGGVRHQDDTMALEQLGPAVDDEIAPAYERESTIGESSSAAILPALTGTIDDKTELERQRLLALASSPDDLYGSSNAAVQEVSVPSAPLLEDTISAEDTHDVRHAHRVPE